MENIEINEIIKTQFGIFLKKYKKTNNKKSVDIKDKNKIYTNYTENVSYFKKISLTIKNVDVLINSVVDVDNVNIYLYDIFLKLVNKINNKNKLTQIIELKYYPIIEKIYCKYIEHDFEIETKWEDE